ncbi:MAG: hypothetical protein CMH83_13350 [Nocardioides sp.]|nr:hypothetical protein [Nocardioides sp.]
MTGRARAVAAAVCLVLAAVLLVPATLGWWVRTTVEDTATYVDTVGPLADQAPVQDAVADRVADRVAEQVADAALLDRAAAALEAQGVPPAVAQAITLLREPLQQALDDRVRALADRLVTSPAFAEGWRVANETAHRELLAVLESDDTALVSDDGTISLQLATLVDALQVALVDAGVPGADRIEPAAVTLPLVDSEQVRQAQTGYRLLRTATLALLVLVVVLTAAGVLLARDRRRAARRTAIGAALGLLLLLGVVAFARGHVVGALPTGTDPDAVDAVLEVLTDRLRSSVRWTVLLLLVTAAVLGVDRARARSSYDAARAALERLGSYAWSGPAGLVTAGAAVLLVTFLPSPGPWVVLPLVLLAAAGLGVAAIARRDTGTSTGTGTG